MKFIVLFRDDPEADPNIRRVLMKEHLQFLESNAVAIEAAGPLCDPVPGGRDGLWIVEASDAELVEHLVHQDPFWPTGLRASFAILEWRQVYAGGKRLIDP